MTQNNKINDMLEKYMSEYSQQWSINCCILAAKQGQILFHKAYGLANLEHKVLNSIDTKFWLASITKTFTAVAVMMLQEQGLIDFKDSIKKYLAEYPQFDEKVTIHHLLTHTSGIPNYTDLPNFENEIKRLSYTEAEFMGLFKDKVLEFEPGEKASYSNTGFYLLGVIIQRVSGMSYSEFIKKNIIQKVGLKNSGFVSNDEVVPDMAYGYVYNGPVLVKGPYSDMATDLATGGLYSTCEDLYRFIKSLGNYELISKSSFDLMFQDYHSGYGYGSIVGESFSRKTIGHNGSYCGFLTQYIYYPQDDVFVCVLGNNSYTNVWRLCDDLAGIILEESVSMPVKPVKIEEANSEFDEYIGVYDSGSGFKITISKNADIFNMNFNKDNLYTIYPVAKDVFCNEFLDEKYVFERDENGVLSLWGCKKVSD